MAREAKISLKLQLNEEDVPEKILWKASESEEQGERQCDAMFLSLWDRKENNTLTIDLWTKSMQVKEMNTHYYFTIMKMADTYEKATNNKEVAEKFREFANDFAGSVKEFTPKGN